MPFDSQTAKSAFTYIAYVCTDEGARVVQSVLQHSGGDTAALHGGGLSGAARMISDKPDADIMLTEVGNIPVDAACEYIAEISRTGVSVIVLGAQTDIDTYRALRKAGASEYFSFPVNAADILDVRPDTGAPAKVIKMPEPAAKAPSIAVLGSNGGVGASLLAQNLAFHASAPKGARLRTALVDSDLYFGSQAIDLDRDETAGLFEALMAPDRIDTTFIGATMDHLNDRLSLYSQQVRIGQDAQAYEKNIARLFAPLRAEFDALVTDIPRTLLMQQPQLVEQFDMIVLVVPAGFAGVNAASRLIERLVSQHGDLRILPVLSDLRRDAGLSIKDVQSTLGHKVVATLPRCDVHLARAHRAARPMIEQQPRGAYAKAVQAIWTRAMATDTPKVAKRTWFKKATA